jgi:hypothetical protein
MKARTPAEFKSMDFIEYMYEDSLGEAQRFHFWHGALTFDDGRERLNAYIHEARFVS